MIDAPEVLAVIREPDLSRVGDLINSLYNSEYATFFQSLGKATAIDFYNLDLTSRVVVVYKPRSLTR